MTRASPRPAKPDRLSRARLDEWLRFHPPAVRRLVRVLREVVLKAAPGAAESVKFGVLSYYHPGAWFGSIGGNICMIEVKGDRVLLSFIRGALLDDPGGVLGGAGKFKRFVAVADEAGARRLAGLVRQARDLEP